MFPPTVPTRTVLLFSIFLLAVGSTQAQDFYWIGGTGDWNDIDHWSKRSGDDEAPTGAIPDENSTVFIDDLSGPASGYTITLPPGAYSVMNLAAISRNPATLFFNGISSSGNVNLKVFGDLALSSGLTLSYASPGFSSNVWKFEGDAVHNINLSGQDLSSVELHDEDGTFYQRSDLLASARIRMYGGTWNSNGHDVSSNVLYFRDSESSSAPLSKNFNTDGSNIYTDEWNSRFTYGSLTVNGAHQIYTQVFAGSPIQLNGTGFHFDEIHLLEYSDDIINGSLIETNNFDCNGCVVEQLIIEDTGKTQLADRFTVNQELRVVNPGSTILFNGGNSRTSEVTLNGTVKTPPASDCGELTVFSNAYNDYSTFTRASGNLFIKDAEIRSIRTNGDATFNLSNGLLQGASIGWNLVNSPSSREFVWLGPDDGSFGDWDNPANWAFADGSATGSCLPSASDDVLINDRSKGKMRIPNPYLARCRNLYWTNREGLELKLDGGNGPESALQINGSFNLDPSAIFTTAGNHEIYFSSTTSNSLNTAGVPLPEIRFTGDLATWNLQSNLICDRLTFEGGTMNTRNNDIETDYWHSIQQSSKHLNFGSSHIKVNGEFVLSRYTYSNVTVDPGTSLIECKKLTSTVEELYDVRLNNSSSLALDNYNYRFNKLILGGTGEVTVQNDLTVSELIFAVDESTLKLHLYYSEGSSNNEYFIVKDGIESLATAAAPAVLKSGTTGDRMRIDQETEGNICVTGPVAFQDISSAISGVLNAPEGIDNGNNEGISFEDGAGSSDLYWIGGSGDWQQVENWSLVSGGCPDIKSPNDASRLYFNNFSFTDAAELVTVRLRSACGEVHFTNTNYPANFDILSGLSADLLNVSNGRAVMTGKNLSAQVTRVQNGGFLSSDMLNFTTDKLDTEAGLVIVRSGSALNVNDQ